MNDQSSSIPVPTVQIGELKIQDIDGELRIEDIDLGRKLGFSEPKKIRLLIKRHAASLAKLGPRPTVSRVVNGGNAEVSYLNRKQAIFITAKSETEIATEVTIDIVKRFDEYETGGRQSAPELPDFSNPVAAARAWADQVEARQMAERTKAEIGSRREATAMATASVATRKVNALKIELDQSHEYATVKRMEIHHGRKFSWRPLKTFSLEAGIEIKDVPDVNYEKVNAYRADVWRSVYQVEIPLAAGKERI